MKRHKIRKIEEAIPKYNINSLRFVKIITINEKTKQNIWKYLQAFCVINISKNSNDKINEVLKSIESNEKVISSQKIVRLSKAITNTPTVNPMNKAIKIKEI